MADNLDMSSGPNTVFASLYSDEEWTTKSLLHYEATNFSKQELNAICKEAKAALERVVEWRKDQTTWDEHWKELLRVGRKISAVLPPTVWENLSQSDRKPALALRLRSELVAMPWELLHLGDRTLLGEKFNVGRQIVAPANRHARPAPALLKPPVNVLIVVDDSNPEGSSITEGQLLYDRLKSDERFNVKILIGKTYEDLARELPSADILHFAGEAKVYPKQSYKTMWRLRKNVWFDCDDLRKAGLERWPVLVFANACNTAQIVRNMGEWGVDSIAFNLLQNGVRHYVSTLAFIPDTDVVVQFALNFYEALLSNEPVGAALRIARTRLSAGDLYNRMIASCYLHYGNPNGRLFAQQHEVAQETNSGLIESGKLDTLIEGIIALRQGRLDEAGTSFISLKKELRHDKNAVKQLNALLQEIDDDRSHLQEDQERLKEGAQFVTSSTRIGLYERIKELGHGSYRTVYLANSYNPDIPVSKVALALPYNQQDDFVQRQREIFRQLQPKLNHPGLVQIYYVEETGKPFYVVYEHVEGTLLQDLMTQRSEPWPVDEACGIVTQIGIALDAAHHEDIVHGALTPQEIFCLDDQTIKILDMGCARPLQGARLRNALTENTYPYRAPEHWRLHVTRFDAMSDLWALAVIAYQLLTGHHPFEPEATNNEHEENAINWADATLKLQIKPASLYRPDLPEGLVNVLTHALSTDPSGRYNSAGEFVRALERARAGVAKIGGFVPDLELALETNAALLAVETNDQFSTLQRLQAIAERFGRSFYTWRLTCGLTEGFDPEAKSLGYASDPAGVLTWLRRLDQPIILVLLDYDVYFDETPIVEDPVEYFRELNWAPVSRNPPRGHGPEPLDHLDFDSYASVSRDELDLYSSLTVYQKQEIQQQLDLLISESSQSARAPRTAIIVSNLMFLPDEIVRSIQVCEAEPATPVEIYSLLDEVAQSTDTDVEKLDEFATEFVWQSAGLSVSEIRDCLRLSVTRRKVLDWESCLSDLQRDKEQIVRRVGLLELWHPSVTLADVVGLDLFKDQLRILSMAVDSVVTGILPPPKGMLLGGMPGCGKSLCAQAIAGTWKWPLLRLDVGRIFGGLLGQSERNMELALRLAEKLAPVVLWVDEIEKGFGQSQGNAISGTASRVFQTFLTWMQERTKCVFLVATANEEGGIPPELLRAGRFDMCYFLDWPNFDERGNLIAHFLMRYGRDPEAHDFEALAAQTAGFSSAELHGRVINALYTAAQDGEENPTPEQLHHALKEDPPAMGRRPRLREQLQMVREMWLSVARPASSSA